MLTKMFPRGWSTGTNLSGPQFRHLPMTGSCKKDSARSFTNSGIETDTVSKSSLISWQSKDDVSTSLATRTAAWRRSLSKLGVSLYTSVNERRNSCLFGFVLKHCTYFLLLCFSAHRWCICLLCQTLLRVAMEPEDHRRPSQGHISPPLHGSYLCTGSQSFFSRWRGNLQLCRCRMIP